jgi:predicted dehydrogenase
MGQLMRAGLVGTGFIGSVHARSLRAAGITLAGVASSTPERAEAAARHLGADRAFASALELVQSPGIDVVHIATPNHLHFELTLAALQAGKHVVCEKPLALRLDDALQMAETAERCGLLGAVPFVYRFHPMAREARNRAQSSDHGPVRAVHGSYLQDWLVDPDEANWRVDLELGGPSRAFADIGSHWCDLAEWVTGHRISDLVATTAATVPERPGIGRPTFSAGSTAALRGAPDEPARKPVETEDLACLVLHTDMGAVGTVTVSQVAPGRKNRLWLEVDGERRSVVFDQEMPEELWIGQAASAESIKRDPAVLSEPARRYAILPAGHAQGFHDCFDAFVRDVYASIESGEPVEGLPTFADGVRAARITAAVLESAAKRSWIEV